ncbi:MAG: hypothetical protein AB7K24_16925 [Gemmataceae bacterium]
MNKPRRHALGRRALQPDGSRRKLTEAEATKLGIPLSTWRTARQLADPDVRN